MFPVFLLMVWIGACAMMLVDRFRGNVLTIFNSSYSRPYVMCDI